MDPYKADVETLARCARFVNEWVAAGGPGVYVIDRAEFDWLCAVMADGVAPISVHAVFDKAVVAYEQGGKVEAICRCCGQPREVS